MSSLTDLILIGGGGHCHACIDVLEQEGRFQIAGIVERNGGPREAVLGYPVLGADEDLAQLKEKYEFVLVTVGQIKSAIPRKLLYEKLITLGFQLPVILSPRSYVSPHARVGSGTIVMHDVLVNAGAHVGENCILNSKSLIEHDAVIGDHCHISTGSILNGEAQIGHESFVGSGAVVREGVRIGARSLIAGGARVMGDLAENSNYKNSL